MEYDLNYIFSFIQRLDGKLNLSPDTLETNNNKDNIYRGGAS